MKRKGIAGVPLLWAALAVCLFLLAAVPALAQSGGGTRWPAVAMT